MEKILIVDDDRYAAATLAQGLECASYRVEAVHSGKDGIAAARTVIPDLVFVDLRLPDLSGIDVAKELQTLKLPFVFFSAYDDHQAVRVATELGAFAYLVKPITIRQILPIITAVTKRAAEVSGLRQCETQLQGIRETGLIVAMATGILMQRFQIDRKAAYERLRSDARRQRRKVRDCASQVVQQFERTVN